MPLLVEAMVRVPSLFPSQLAALAQCNPPPAPVKSGCLELVMRERQTRKTWPAASVWLERGDCHIGNIQNRE